MNRNDETRNFQDFTDEQQALLMGLYKWYTLSFQPMSVFFQGEFRALVYLLEHGKSTPTDLIEPLGVSRQRVTTILAGLRDKGYIKMEMDSHDRRKMQAELTQEGLDYFVEQSKVFGSYLEHAVRRIGTDGIRQFLEIIDRLTAPEEEIK